MLPGPDGNHVHVYLDDKEVGILRQLKGSYAHSDAGRRKARHLHQGRQQGAPPIGLQRCVGVTVR